MTWMPIYASVPILLPCLLLLRGTTAALRTGNPLIGLSSLAGYLCANWETVSHGVAGLRELSVRELFSARSRTNLELHGNWQRQQNQALNAETLFGRSPETRLSFEVTGERFGIHCLRHDFSGVISISLDGRPQLLVDVFGAWHKDTENLLVVDNLGIGTRRVTVEITGKSDQSHDSQLHVLSLFLLCRDDKSGQFDRLNPSSLPRTTIAISSQADRNVGDIASSPTNYFSWLRKVKRFDMFDWHPANPLTLEQRISLYRDLAECNVILGGGGLLSTSWFAPALEFISRSVKKRAVLWGVGHNSAEKATWRSDYNDYNVSAANFGPIGVRDYGTRFQWVPCASCLAPALDRHVNIVRDIGFVVHEHNYQTRDYLSKEHSNIEMISNFGELEDVIQFIQESALIVTNSFHAAYWAVLARRKVIGIPTSSKFFSFKHPIPLADISDWRSRCNEGEIYEEALAECRNRNWEFEAAVLEYFSD